MSLTSEVREYARSCGAEGFGVTSANPFVDYLDAVAEIENFGKLKGLTVSKYINSAMADARNALRSTRSIIVVGVPYKLRVLSDDSPQYQGPHVFLSRYWRHARRLHVNLGQSIAEYLQNQGFEAKAVGHRGIPLKPAAIRAGLANYGKNTTVYNKQFGSWVWWFVVITEADLELTEASAEDICGKCNRCIQACPTGAIYEPYKLDLLKCRSYLTHASLQDVGEIADSLLKEKMGNCLCGCEICQDVCPLNRKVERIETNTTFDISFYGVPLPDQERLPLLDLLELLKGQCSHYFKRYAAISIGNLEEADAALPVLTKMSDPEDELVRKYSAWAIGRIKRRKRQAHL